MKYMLWLILILAFFISSSASAKTVILAWDKYPNLADIRGFEIFYRPFGNSTFDLKHPISVAPNTATQATLTIPDEGFLSIRVVSKSGAKSVLSREIATISIPKAIVQSSPIALPGETAPSGKIPPTRTLSMAAPRPGEKLPRSRQFK